MIYMLLKSWADIWITSLFRFNHHIKKRLHKLQQIFILQDRDADRTIGIDTDYIETQDYDLEPDDKEFLIEVWIYCLSVYS